MTQALKGKASTNIAQAWRLVNEIPAPVALMMLAAPVFAFVSGTLFFTIQSATKDVLHFSPWVPVGIWIALLLIVAIKPINIMATALLGARLPSPAEKEYLMPLWQEVIRRAGVRPGRYALRVTEDRGLPFDRDLGPYVVTVDRADIQLLSPEELSSVLAQRVSRQRIMLSPVLGISFWALLPAALGLLVAIAILAALRTIYRAIFGGVDEAMPYIKTDGCAAGALVLIAFGIVVFIAFVVVGLFSLEFLTEAIIGAVIFCGLARSAEKRADSIAIQLGYGPALAAAIKQAARATIEFSGWRNLVNTSLSPNERITHIASRMSAAAR